MALGAKDKTQLMARWLALDYGLKRCGLAVTDPSNIIASPLETVATTQLMSFLKNYMQTEPVELLIVGLPVNLDDAASEMTTHVESFISQWKKIYPKIPVQTIDERFTSSIAKQALLIGGMKKSGRQKKENLDKVSAAVILQSFMEKQAFLNRQKG